MCFYYNRRSVSRLSCPLLAVHAASGPDNGPIWVGHVNLWSVAFAREELCNRPLYLHDKPSRYTVKRCEMLLKHHTPSIPHRDPYLVAVLIALAQRQVQFKGPETRPLQDSYMVRHRQLCFRRLCFGSS